MNQAFLTGKDKTFAAFLTGLFNKSHKDLSSKTLTLIIWIRIKPKNHLPGPIFIMHTCLFIHFIRKIPFIRHKSIDKRNQTCPVK